MTTFARISDSDALAGDATHITLNELGFFSLTAVRTGSGNLELINWRTGDTVARVSDSGNQAGEVHGIAITRNLNRTVTAVRNGSGNLELISWDDGSGQGNITRLADSGNQAGAVGWFAIQPLYRADTAADLVTAVETGANTLKLITWNLDSGSGALTRLGDSGNQAGEVSMIAASVLSGNIVVTAVRNGSGNLELITWFISPDGKTIQRRADSGTQAGEVHEVAIASAVTAVRNGSGRLELISWGISPDGLQIKRLSDSGHQAGEATHINISQFDADRFVTALRAGNGKLKLIAFDVDGTGTIKRTGDSDDLAGAVSEVTLATPAQNNFTTAVRDGRGHLKLITWKMQD